MGFKRLQLKFKTKINLFFCCLFDTSFRKMIKWKHYKTMAWATMGRWILWNGINESPLLDASPHPDVYVPKSASTIKCGLATHGCWILRSLRATSPEIDESPPVQRKSHPMPFNVLSTFRCSFDVSDAIRRSKLLDVIFDVYCQIKICIWIVTIKNICSHMLVLDKTCE